MAKAIPKDGRASAFWLERRRNQTWGERKQLNLNQLTNAQIIALLEGDAAAGGADARADIDQDS